MARIKKAVLPVAGLGTRMLPVTKVIPKEMLPLVDVPTVQLVVEECVASGIEEIIFVTSPGRSMVMEHFQPAPVLEGVLTARRRTADLEMVQRLAKLASFRAVVQPEPLGLGHAVLCAREAVGNEPFAVLLSDDLMFSHGRPAVAQLIDEAEMRGAGVIALMTVTPGQEHLYGMARRESVGPRAHRISALVEKPAKWDAADDGDRFAVMGRYALPPEIFELLAQTRAGHGGEIQITDGLHALAVRGGLYGYEIDAERFDTGTRAGYVLAGVHRALNQPALADAVRAGLQKLLS